MKIKARTQRTEYLSFSNYQTMKTNLLLPYGFKKIGWAILIPTLALGILMLIDGFDGFPSFLHAGDTPASGFLNSATMTYTLNNVALIGICIGGIMVACSRERIEDELISRIRLNSLLVALYVNYALLIAAALLVYDIQFLNIMVYNLFTMLLIFLAVFRWKLCRLRKEAGNEE